jgi:hypothetical protein
LTQVGHPEEDGGYYAAASARQSEILVTVTPRSAIFEFSLNVWGGRGAVGIAPPNS